MTLSGWCSFGRSFTADNQHSDWGLTLGSFPQPSSSSWALSLGRYMSHGPDLMTLLLRALLENDCHSGRSDSLHMIGQQSISGFVHHCRCVPCELGAWKSSPLVAESMLRFCVDDRLALAPSLICLKADGGMPSLAIALRSEWEL